MFYCCICLWIESAKEHNLFKIFCNIINAIFHSFNAFLLNKNINFIKIILYVKQK